MFTEIKAQIYSENPEEEIEYEEVEESDYSEVQIQIDLLLSTNRKLKRKHKDATDLFVRTNTVSEQSTDKAINNSFFILFR